jgi:hypothetical protein
MFNFCTSAEQVVKQPSEQAVKQPVEQVSDTSINSINKKKQIKQTNRGKGELHSPEKTKNSEANPSSSKTLQRFAPPTIEEVKIFFSENNMPNADAEKFFNHFESNGWLVGGKAKMKNWKAAARNWISRSAEFNKKTSVAKPGNLNVNQNKDYSVPL